ncbi:hypothetical protein ACNOYE_18895 [Nannocystaceae bacterium ST9]
MARHSTRALTIAAILIGSLGVAQRAEAGKRSRLPMQRGSYELQVRFEPLPLVGLQPETARLVLDLPVELLPPRQPWYGFDFDGSFKQWDFQVAQIGRPTRHARQHASASLGAGFKLVVDDPHRAIRFRMSLLPRAAVAVLSF